MTTIRSWQPADAEAVVEIMAAADDTRVLTAEAWLHELRTTPERGRELCVVAVEDGEVVGTGGAGLDWTTSDAGEGWAFAAVAPASRGRGIGSALYERVLAHVHALGARRARTLLREECAGFARARGWRELRAEAIVAVDPRRVEVHPGIPGFRVAPLPSVAVEDVYALDQLASRDEPSSVEHEGLPFDEWLEIQWRTPSGSLDAGSGVLEGDRLVALAFLRVDLARGRGENGFTATHPDYRGRGLARLAKTRSLRWAAEHGIERVTTGNDERNAPMRAVNRRLGYEPAARRLELELPLGNGNALPASAGST